MIRRVSSLALVGVIGCAHVRPFPALPSSIETMVGRVTVHVVPDLHADDGDKVWGVWYWGARLIEIEAHATIEAQWQALEHERCHVALDASGLSYTLTSAQAEAVCDAIGTQRMRERFG